VIATANNTVLQTITVGSDPTGVAVTPDGSKVYVADQISGDVAVIDTATNAMVGIGVGSFPVAFGNFIGPPILTVSETGTGSGQVTTSPAGINCSGSSNQCALGFPYLTTVTLTASAAAGSAFAGWSGGCGVSTETCVITLDRNINVNAMFTAVPSFLLTVAVGGSGSGTVMSNPSGINCPGACSASYQQGTQVVLTAAPVSGSTFAGWNGAGCSGTSPCAVTMSAAENVTANFTAVTETLTVAENGNGAGQVTSSPPGINCSASSTQCAASFAMGTQVTLTASASAGSSFVGWSGGGCGSTSPCVVTMSAAQSVTATFNVIPSFMLSVVPSGNGSGTVTSTPSGINCGATCNASFQQGTQVTLTAAAANGSTLPAGRVAAAAATRPVP
jgi:YVTN family beta-propeller protein